MCLVSRRSETEISMKSPFDLANKYLENSTVEQMPELPEIPPRAWVIEEVRSAGKLQAVKICSAAIDAHLWLVLDKSFTPADDLAVFFPEELENLKSKSIDTFKKVLETKLTYAALGIARMVQP